MVGRVEDGALVGSCVRESDCTGLETREDVEGEGEGLGGGRERT